LLPVQAESRAIVVPDDYPTITAAIGNATNGNKILVRSGTYNEQSLKTNMSISLIGEDTASTIVNLTPPIVNFTVMGQYVGTGYDAAIEFHADNIVISGLTVNCYGGIAIFGNHVILMGNAISNYEGNWIHVNGNYETISNNTLNVVTDVQCSYSGVSANTGTGSIAISNWGSCNSVFYNNMSGSIGGATLSSSNLYYGNIVNGGKGMYAKEKEILVNNTITNCNWGVNLERGCNSIVVGNSITNNYGPGLTTDGLNNTFYVNYVANNWIGIQVATYSELHSANFTVYDNDFVNNNVQAQVNVVNQKNYWYYGEQGVPWSDNWNYSKEGNYWSDYLSRYPNATEVDASGIGNIPYIVGGGEQDNCPLVNPFDISSINIQLPTWANITLPSPLQTPSFPPAPSPSPSPSPTPSPSPSLSPTATPPDAEPKPFPTAPVAAASAALVGIIGVGLFVYFKTRKR
jgi:hypothetical protein